MQKLSTKYLESIYSSTKDQNYSSISNYLDHLLNEEMEDEIEHALIAIIDSKLINIVETKSMLIREKEVIEYGQNVSNPTSEN